MIMLKELEMVDLDQLVNEEDIVLFNTKARVYAGELKSLFDLAVKLVHHVDPSVLTIEDLKVLDSTYQTILEHSSVIKVFKSDK